MHVMFVSACKGKALQRTRKILDRYAVRVDPTTWATPITQEALSEIHSLLRKTASRNTAVACYLNKGVRKLQLKFVVGRRALFGESGAYPIKTGKPPPKKLSAYDKVVAACAELAGFFHDVGKATEHFQQKLRAPVLEKDPLRHELISTAILHELLKGASFSEAWDNVSKYSEQNYANVVNSLYGVKKKVLKMPPIESELDSFDKVVMLSVLTHHKIKDTSEGQASSGVYLLAGTTRKAKLFHAFSPFFRKEVQKKLALIKRIQERESDKSPDFWLKVFHDARIATILADHEVSARIDPPSSAKLFANTALSSSGTSRLNQPLESHLFKVSNSARDYACHIARHQIPGLPASLVNQILANTSNANFEWQNEAVVHLKSAPSKPSLVFNLAGTGAGKTFMNIKALLALNARDAVSIALNLRTLTLQTAYALAELTGMDNSQLACVLGDSSIADWQAHLKDKTQVRDDDENGEVPEVVVNSTDYDVEPWTKALCNRYRYAPALLAAPFLVSTTDYLIEAAALPSQARHALSLIRVSKSSLILDEVDSYDAKAMVAVMRLLFVAGMYQKNVVLSSATLSPPIAALARDAYQAGLQASGISSKEANVHFISNRAKPFCCTLEKLTDKTYSEYATSMFETEDSVTKLARIIPLDSISPPSVYVGCAKVMWETCQEFHTGHHVIDPLTGKRVSLGLIRVANISSAIGLSKQLSRLIGEKGGVCCYHSRHLALTRFYMERELDKVLTRKAGNPALDSPQIRAIINSTSSQDIYLVVVATPVEEVGRDHDFDYALIEPSSAQSVVQTAGRVNRHRKVPVTSPNVGIWQFPIAYLKSKSRARVFEHPGLEEVSYKEYPSHDLLVLWPEIGEPLSAKSCLLLRDNGSLAHHDRKALEYYFENELNRRAAYPHQSITQKAAYLDATTFRDWKLRHGVAQQAHYFDVDKGVVYREEYDDKVPQWVSIGAPIIETLETGTALFTPTVDELRDLARQLRWGYSRAYAFTVPYSAGTNRRDLTWHQDFGWYFPEKQSR